MRISAAGEILRSWIVVCVLALLLPVQVFAKPEVAPIVHDGIRYEVAYHEIVLSNQVPNAAQDQYRMRAFLSASDEKSNKHLWKKLIYERVGDAAAEKDAQWIYVNEFALVELTCLIMVNEAQETFIFNFDSQSIYQVPDNESQQPPEPSAKQCNK